MKLKHILLAGSLALGTMTTSCSDFLDIAPTNSQTQDTFFAGDSGNARQALMGVYEKLRSDYLNSQLIPIALSADVMSDDVYTGGGSATDVLPMQQMARFKAPTNNTTGHTIWQKCYIGIQRANTLLNNYESITFRESEAAMKDNFKGEAMFLRAHYYFELVRYFENVPLIKETLDGVTIDAVTQATPQEVYAFIAKDMQEAIPLMAEQAEDEGRLTKYSAMAELLKVYLFYTGVYQSADLPVEGGSAITKADARVIADDIITNSGASLEANYADLFNQNGNFSNESLFEIVFAGPGWGDWGDGSLGNMQSQMSGPRSHNSDLLSSGWGFGVPTRSLEAAFEEGDTRKASTVIYAKDLADIKGEKDAVSPNYTYTSMFANKYTTHTFRKSADNYELNWAQNYHYIRLADVYLMAAELYLGVDDAKATQYVNTVRDRAGLSALAIVDLNAIYAERRAELAMEGHRYWDLLRRGLDYAKQNIDVTGYTLTEPTETGDLYITSDGENLTGDIGEASSFEVNFDLSKKGFLPIPQPELDLNSNLQQNAGY